MLNININYPYPVIREYTDDYQSTEFIGELKVLLEPDGYAVHTNFEINNKGIQILLSKRILTYGSKLDGEIFSEFSRDWTNLSYQAQLIRAKLQNKDISEVIDLGDIDVIPAGKYRDQMMKTRVGQYFFRMTVLNSYENRCCVTGLKQPELLVASHIKPWKVSDERTERTNPASTES